MLTVLECTKLVRHALGREPNADISPLRIINETSQRLTNMRRWKFLEDASTAIDFVASQNYASLPADFGDFIAADHTQSLVSAFYFTTLGHVLELRTTAVTVGGWTFYGAVQHSQAATGSGAPSPQLALWPTPTSNETGAITIFYRAIIPALVSDGQKINIPTWIEPLYIELLREVARGYEEGESESMSVRVTRVVAGMTYRDAVSKDVRVQPYYGRIRNGAVDSRYIVRDWGQNATVGGP